MDIGQVLRKMNDTINKVTGRFHVKVTIYGSVIEYSSFCQRNTPMTLPNTFSGLANVLLAAACTHVCRNRDSTRVCLDWEIDIMLVLGINCVLYAMVVSASFSVFPSVVCSPISSRFLRVGIAFVRSPCRPAAQNAPLL